jgi:hypothetical protein
MKPTICVIRVRLRDYNPESPNYFETTLKGTLPDLGCNHAITHNHAKKERGQS